VVCKAARRHVQHGLALLLAQLLHEEELVQIHEGAHAATRISVQCTASGMLLRQRLLLLLPLLLAAG